MIRRMRKSAFRLRNKNDCARLRLYRGALKRTLVLKACLEWVHNGPFSCVLCIDEMQNQGFIDTIMAKIINNFQVTVRNIHVRYEDSLSCPGVSSVPNKWLPALAHLV